MYSVTLSPDVLDVSEVCAFGANCTSVISETILERITLYSMLKWYEFILQIEITYW